MSYKEFRDTLPYVTNPVKQLCTVAIEEKSNKVVGAFICEDFADPAIDLTYNFSKKWQYVLHISESIYIGYERSRNLLRKKIPKNFIQHGHMAAIH